MPFHALWFVMILGIVGVPVAAVVVAIVIATSRRPQPVQYSPDGRWWWDGRQWQPVPHPPLPPQS